MTKEISKKEMQEMMDETKAQLDKEPKVRIKLRLDKSGKASSVPVCINGYIYLIRRGEAVEVPQTVAEILENADYI